MKLSHLILITSFILFIVQCGEYQRPSKGQFFEVTVVMDSTQFNSELADTLKAVFEAKIPTLPSYEEMYSLSFFAIKTAEDVEKVKRTRNVIIAAPSNEKSYAADFINSIFDPTVKTRIASDQINAVRLDDKWSSNQWALILSGSSKETIINYLSENREPIVESLNERERKRWVYEIYRKGRQTAIEDTLWQEYGWKMGIQHDYQWNIRNDNLVSFRRFSGNNDRWIWVWWEDDVNDLNFLDDEWINKKRDEILEENIRGSREGSFVQTEYRRPVIHKTKELNGRYTIQTNGTWQMINDLMGGPFVNYTIYDEDQRRLYMLEFAQFAPKFNKKRFVRQFEAMSLTFETDSLFEKSQKEMPNS